MNKAIVILKDINNQQKELLFGSSQSLFKYIDENYLTPEYTFEWFTYSQETLYLCKLRNLLEEMNYLTKGFDTDIKKFIDVDDILSVIE
jgi:hypothetical protein